MENVAGGPCESIVVKPLGTKDNRFKQNGSEFKASINDQQWSDSNWEKVRQEVTCAICLELLVDPKSMPCLHTYCKKCLIEAITKRPHDPYLPRDRPAINCPLCRAEVALSDKGIEALPSNFSATRLVETVQLQDKLEQNKTPLCDGCKENDAVAFCCDCSRFFLCEYCAKAHKNIPATKNHDLMSLKDISIPKPSLVSVKRSPLCQKHPEEPLKLYCQDCEVLVCRDCVLVEHKSHNYSFVDDIIEEEKQKLKDVTLQELDKILTSTKKAITGVEQMQAKVLSCNDQHVAQLNKTFHEITDMVIKHKENLLGEINQITKETLSPLKKQQADLITLKDNTEKCHNFTQNTLQNGTNSEIMSARKQMLERTKHLKESHGGLELLPVSKPTKTVSYHLDKIRAEIEQVMIFVDLQQCQIKDAPLEAYEEEAVTLKVILKDHKGQPICKAANVLTVGVTTPTIIKANVATSVKELKDGKYSVSFTPVAHGDHTMTIQINDLHISKSPVNINVKPGLKVVDATPNLRLMDDIPLVDTNTSNFMPVCRMAPTDFLIDIPVPKPGTTIPSNTHPTVVTCTSNSDFLAPGFAYYNSTVSQPPRQVRNQPKVSPRSKSKYPIYGGW